MLIYLCGPINGRSDADCKDWREQVKAAWHGQCLDPMRRDYRGRELEPGIDAEIVSGDKEDIEGCDGLIVYYDKPSAGTCMEIFYAAQLGKPVALVDRTDKPLSPWITHHCTYIGRSIADAMAHLSGRPAHPRKTEEE